MYEHDERYEMDDLDKSIEEKKGLIEEAKQITEDTDYRVVNDLKRRWNRIHGWESALEESMEEEFNEYLDAYYGKRREVIASYQAKKEELIQKAKALVKPSDFKKATEDMNALMEEWKQTGFCGKELDDKLWEEFRSARQAFFDAKHDHWQSLQDQFEQAKQTKETIVQKAKELADSDEFKKARNEFQKLMDEWKSVGSAGREFEQSLWNEFNEHRQKFYERQNAHYEQMRASYGDNYEKKRKLVTEAQDIAYQQEYTREQTERMKQMSAEWKEIGFCGKENEDKVWQYFRQAMDEYFEGLRNRNNR